MIPMLITISSINFKLKTNHFICRFIKLKTNMTIKYLKKSPKTSSTDDSKTAEIVLNLLKDIEISKEQGCMDLTKILDMVINS